MAKKSFVLSNGDGRVTFSNTGSISIDDGTSPSVVTERGHISASNLYIANNYTIRSITANNTYRMLSSSAGQFATSSVSGAVGPSVGPSGALGFNGTSSVVTSIMNPSDYAGIPADQTYLSGNYQEGIKVININTVSSGALKPAYGGTGLSGSQYTASKNLILKGNGSSPAAFSVLSASASGTIIVSGEGRFGVQYPSYKPDVRFYGTPGTYTWTRPIGARFARVILQGAGGGGGGGGTGSPVAVGGGGGASGGYSDIIIDVSSLISASIIVGTGGTGGAGGATGASAAGNSGGNTLWRSTINQYISYGGAGGGRGATSSTTRSVGGIGITKNGLNGAAAYSPTLNVAEVAYGMPSGGGKGTGVSTNAPPTSGGTIVPILNPPDKNFGYNISTDNSLIITTMASGGAGSLAFSSAGSNATGYGAGGGGGSAGTVTGQFSSGGSGGDGYALIISW